MKISSAKLYKMFGLDAYKDKYGEFIHDVSDELLEKQLNAISNQEWVHKKRKAHAEKTAGVRCIIYLDLLRDY